MSEHHVLRLTLLLFFCLSCFAQTHQPDLKLTAHDILTGGFPSQKGLWRDTTRKDAEMKKTLNNTGAEFERITDKYEALIFNQSLDHKLLMHYFPEGAWNDWGQRYWEDWSSYKVGGPVFLYIDQNYNEDPDNDFVAGFDTYFGELAAEFGAVMYILEARNSLSGYHLDTLFAPFGLDPDQILGDTAHFIIEISKLHGLNTSPWIVFGSEYAAWMRVKFPHLVTAGIAVDALVESKLDYFDPLQKLSDFYGQSVETENSGLRCDEAIGEAFKEYDYLARIGDYATLVDALNLCSLDVGATEKSKHMQLTFIKQYIILDFFGPAAFMADHDPNYDYDYDDICLTMTDETEPSYLNRMKKLLASSSCLDLDYAEFVEDFSRFFPLNWWACSQVSILTTNVDNTAFGDSISLASQEQLCNDLLAAGYSGLGAVPPMDCLVSKTF